MAADLYDGVARGLPGESAGYGRASGDFAVGYVLTREYAHNLQQELGFFNASPGPEARPFELQADCLPGAWANSAYDEGVLRRADLDEISTPRSRMATSRWAAPSPTARRRSGAPRS